LIDDVQQCQQQMYNMQVQQLNALELYGNNLLSTSVVKLVCMGLQCDWSCCYSRDILVRILKISEGLLHWGSDKQGGGCDVVHGAEKSKHLLELPGASDSLKLFVADLMEPGCFDGAWML
jgi:hypothetical protein